ncbi:hypothetical protein MKW92_053797 [Papaver armeniacum]|nr:hypothetical protein MKW92_053797 [Papaver armeniacum]
MVFFDFNVPYLEPEKTDSNGKKNTRLKIAVKAMELGYSGVAYNRCMKGVMSDKDRCTIYLFPVSSLLKASPTLSDSVKFHRELLKVPLNTPFRQYTRLTVTVENIVQAGVLNSGNPVLKTYDLVAVKPLNQTVFDHVCKVSEVDLIAIDFSERLPFRLKLPMVKAAIEVEGILEITYSHLISDIQARRQIVTNAKWIGHEGKNIIFTSGASSVNELRGPYDVANLSSLLGLYGNVQKLRLQRIAGLALIARALRKKQFFKEAIREPWYADCNNWDEISSGEGDIQLDDIAAIDFVSVTKDLPSYGMRLNDWWPAGGDKSQLQEDTPISDAKSDESPDMDKISKHPDGPEVVPFHIQSRYLVLVKLLPYFMKNLSSDKVYQVLDAAEIVPHDTPSQDCISMIDVDLMLPDNVVSGLSSVGVSGTSFSCQANPIMHTTVVDDLVFPMETAPACPLLRSLIVFPQIGNSEILNSSDDAMGAHAVNMEKIISETGERKQIDLVAAGCDMPIVLGELEEIQNSCDAVVLLADDKPVSFHKRILLFEIEKHAQEGVIEMSSRARDESTSGK